MHVRKLVKAGEASHTISLPKTWLERNSLKKGDTIYINENPSNELVISSEKKEAELANKEITITVDDKELGTIQREITSAYINNYNTITIIGKNLNQPLKEIRKTIHDFVALEIVEQTATKIVAKDLLNLQEINLNKTIRRMDMILRSVITDSLENIGEKDISESVSYRDYDVNRLYFLMYRLMKGTMDDIRIAESFKIKNSDALATWYLAMNIEALADSSKNMSLTLHQIKKKDKFSALLKNMEQTYLNAMKAYYTQDKKLADQVALDRMKLVKECDTFLAKNPEPVHIGLVSEMKSMLSNITNIARIVLDFIPSA